MKVADSLVKNISAPSGIAAATSAVDAGIENIWFWYNYFNNFKQRDK